jgi:hypothetical protein
MIELIMPDQKGLVMQITGDSSIPIALKGWQSDNSHARNERFL